jgi:hypothetical protein
VRRFRHVAGDLSLYLSLLDMGAVFVSGASLLSVDAIILLMLIRTNIHLKESLGNKYPS